MKTVFNNLKPIIIYWASLFIYVSILFLDFMSFEACVATFWIIFLILNIVIGVLNKPKDMFIGTIIIELQFLICGAIVLFESGKSPQEPTVVQNIASFGDFFMVAFKNPNVWGLLATMLMPLIPVIIFEIKKSAGVEYGEKSSSFSENKTVKTVFNNLMPIIIYWVSVMLFFNIGIFDYFSYKTLGIIMWSAFMIFNIIMGLCNKLKNVYIGMIIVELQFVICGAIILFEASKTPYVPTFVSYGNYMLAISDNINFGKFIITILLPLAPFVGFGLKKLFEQKKYA